MNKLSAYDRQLQIVELEAKRLLKKIEDYKIMVGLRHNKYYSPERASVKRSSMDLTKELANLRAISVYA